MLKLLSAFHVFFLQLSLSLCGAEEPAASWVKYCNLAPAAEDMVSRGLKPNIITYTNFLLASRDAWFAPFLVVKLQLNTATELSTGSRCLKKKTDPFPIHSIGSWRFGEVYSMSKSSFDHWSPGKEQLSRKPLAKFTKELPSSDLLSILDSMARKGVRVLGLKKICRELF